MINFDTQDLKLKTQNSKLPLGWITAVVFAAGVVAMLLGWWQVALVLIGLSSLYTFFTADIYKLVLFMLVFTAFNSVTVVTAFNFMPINGMKVLQTWREVLEVIIIGRIILKAPGKLWQTRLTALDFTILFFILLNLLYAVLPIGLPGISDRVVALRQNLGHFLAFFVGRLLILTIDQKKLIGWWLAALGIMAGLVAVIERLILPESNPIPEAFLIKVINYPRYFNAFSGYYPGRKEGFLPPFYYYETEFRRAGSFLLSPLELYTFMLLAAALIISWWLVSSREERKGLNVWAGIGLVIVVVAFALAFTRAAYPLMLLIFVLLGLIAGEKRVRWALLGLAGLATVGFIGLFIVSQSIRNVVIRTVTFDDSSSSEHLRRILQGLDAFKDAPFGHGVGIGGITGLRLGPGLGGENSYIARLVDLGILGAFSYLAVLVAMGWAGWVAFQQAKVSIDRIFGLTILVFTVQFALHSFVSEDLLFKVSTHYMFFLVGLTGSWLAQKQVDGRQ